MKSIINRLVLYFIVIIVITVVILEVLIFNIVKQSDYKNLEDSMLSQIKVSSDLYLRYFSDSTLYENVLNNVDTFWKQSTSQVEIIDLSGKVLMDSIGVLPSETLRSDDVKQALKGQKGTWIGKVTYDTENVMAVSYPLSSGDKIVGVLRFITSLREVNKDVNRITYVIFLVGLIVVAVSGFLSIFLANTIVRPLKEVTGVAEKMAKGNLEIRSIKKHDDEIGKLSDTLNHMAKEILLKDKLKNDFIISVSHELRTPLTSIKGWAITLKDGSLEDKLMLMDGLDIIEKESDRLTSMVEELLDFSKFVSGKTILKKEEVNIGQLMDDIKMQLTPRAIKENIEFLVIYDPGMPAIISDENKLKQVFLNILDNSFKFTPAAGKITFISNIYRDKLFFDICDTGCGIPEEDLPKVKEKFYKGKSSKSKNGIGLSISNEIVKLMGGTLDIRSEIDKGTQVLITLPI
jgi:signal transduction histidine kinase